MELAMAAVLCAKELIIDMVQEKVSMLLGVSGEITKLQDNMEGLRAFIEDAERRRLANESMRRWVTKVKDAMYNATDNIDLCQLEADERKESGGDGMEHNNVLLGCLQPLLFCLRNPVFAHKIGSLIKELNQRLEAIHKAARDLSFNINLASFPDQMMLLPAAAGISSYQARSQIDESAIVGEQIGRDTKELIQVLTTTTNDDNDNHHIKVLPIVGIGGVRKTTLARIIFNEATIQEHFKKIWLSITKNFDDVELLRTAIKHARGDHCHGHGEHQDMSILTDILTHTLASSGWFLLVMDDVWSERAWDNVLSVPIRNASQKLPPGSRVLVTTRSAQLPQQMRAPLHEHRVRPLHQDDAWSLLKKQLQPDQGILEIEEEVAVKRLQRYGSGDKEENALVLPRVISDSGAVFHSVIRSLWFTYDDYDCLANTPPIPMDPRPSNILLDDYFMAMLSDFGCTHNSPQDVEFTVTASAKGGTEIKIGSNVIHVPKYSSIRHPLVQMVLFACKKFDDSCYCLKSISPKCIYDMAMRLCSSVWTIVCGTDWISASHKSDSPKMGTISEFDTMNYIGWKKEPTENQSHHSDPDSSRAERGIKAAGTKTPAAWVVATGAPHHATGDRDLLSGFITDYNDQFVHAADGVPMKVLARGAMVSDAVVLPDVWFVPGLTANLVSVSQLTELDYSVGFGCGECCISAAGKVVGKAHLQEGGLYVLDFLKVPLAI